MEKIFDFFKEIGARFKNPLFFSFIITWLLTNWRISIGLLFYNNQQLRLDGYNSYMDMIDKNQTFAKFWGLPFILSLAYTFGFPIIRNVISTFNAWNFRWGSKWALRTAKEGQISFNKYIELKTQLQRSIQEVNEIHKRESTVINENERLRKQIDEFHGQIEVEKQSSKGIQEELNWLRAKSDMNSFNGSWKMKYKDHEGKVKSERITISNGVMSYSNDEAKYETLFKMKICAYNPNSNEYITVFENSKGTNNSRFGEILRPQDQTFNFFKNFEQNAIILELEKLTS
jgi:hypothetical protein